MFFSTANKQLAQQVIIALKYIFTLPAVVISTAIKWHSNPGQAILRKVQRAAGDVVVRQHLALRHLAAGLVGLDLPVCCVEAVGGMAKEDHAQHRHEVVAGGKFRVVAEVVRRLPEVGLEFLDVLEGVVTHAVEILSHVI